MTQEARSPFQKVVVLTGAGISAESGIQTFRGALGLWEGHRVEDVATPGAFLRNPDLVHTFYNERRAAHEGTSGHAKVEPNEAHLALAEFERDFTGEFLLVTQNVDALHERAGSQRLLHMHGELLKVRCTATGEVYDWPGPCSVHRVCACCDVPGRLRPHIVWFGEEPFYMSQIEQALLTCDLFVSIGTSGNVYPAAGFFQIAEAGGAHTVELNLEPSALGGQFAEGIYGSASQIVPAYFRQLLSGPVERLE